MTRSDRGALIRRAQRAVIATSQGPFRHLWRGVYAAVARLWAQGLRGRDRSATVYVRRSLGARVVRYGISDIDLAVVVSGEGGDADGRRGRVLARERVLARAVPAVATTIVDRPMVLSSEDLDEVGHASSLTAGLRGSRSGGRAEGSGGRAVYFGPASHQDRIVLFDAPGLRGPTTEWRRVSGPARALPRPASDRARLRVAAWLQLQSWWRLLLQECPKPASPHRALFCVKLVAEPARIWLALRCDEHPQSHREALERARGLMPEAEPALRRALWLDGRLTESPDPPLAEFVGYLVDLSALIADQLTSEVAALGSSEVRLEWRSSDPLALDPRLAAPALSDAPTLPLCDWRAIVRGGVRWRGLLLSDPPDETLAPVALNPARLDDLVAAVGIGSHGSYPALRSDGLLVLASRRWPRSQLRAVQCPLTDPVSFALLEGRGSAVFPAVPGWSAADVAARGVAEHRTWLAHGDRVVGMDALRPSGGEELGMLLSAARAALFAESVEAGDPVLTPGAAGTLRALRAGRGLEGGLGGGGVVDDVEDAYFAWRRQGVVPAHRLVEAARALVVGLRTYARQ